MPYGIDEIKHKMQKLIDKLSEDLEADEIKDIAYRLEDLSDVLWASSWEVKLSKSTQS